MGFIVLSFNKENLSELSTYFENENNDTEITLTESPINYAEEFTAKNINIKKNTKTSIESNTELKNYLEITKNVPVISSLNEIEK